MLEAWLLRLFASSAACFFIASMCLSASSLIASALSDAASLICCALSFALSRFASTFDESSQPARIKQTAEAISVLLQSFIVIPLFINISVSGKSSPQGCQDNSHNNDVMKLFSPNTKPCIPLFIIANQAESSSCATPPARADVKNPGGCPGWSLKKEFRR